MSRRLRWLHFIWLISLCLFSCQSSSLSTPTIPVSDVAPVQPVASPIPELPSTHLPYGSDELLEEPRVFPFYHLNTVNGLTFTPEGTTLYLTKQKEERDEDGEKRIGIFESHFVDNNWTMPKPVSFNSDYNDYQPVLSPDGERLIFNSTRPIPNSENEALLNLWMVRRTETGWNEPHYLEAINSEGYDGYPAITKNGTLYFTSDREGGLGESDIYMAAWEDGAYGIVQHVPSLSSPNHENDMTVDPDGEFIILNRYFADSKRVDLFISFAVAEKWSDPQPLEQINTRAWELTPTISPNKRYFFYVINGQIQQIDLTVLLSS